MTKHILRIVCLIVATYSAAAFPASSYEELAAAFHKAYDSKDINALLKLYYKGGLSPALLQQNKEFFQLMLSDDSKVSSIEIQDADRDELKKWRDGEYIQRGKVLKFNIEAIEKQMIVTLLPGPNSDSSGGTMRIFMGKVGNNHLIPLTKYVD